MASCRSAAVRADGVGGPVQGFLHGPPAPGRGRLLNSSAAWPKVSSIGFLMVDNEYVLDARVVPWSGEGGRSRAVQDPFRNSDAVAVLCCPHLALP